MDLTTFTSLPGRKLALGLGTALLVLLLCLASAWGGYRHGHTTATNAGEAKYAKLRQEYADAWAESKSKALDRYVTATQRADALATDYLTARQRLAQTRTITLKEIPHATAGLDTCAFSPDFLRVYNQVLGLGSSGMPTAASSGGAAADHSAARASDAGLR